MVEEDKLTENLKKLTGLSEILAQLRGTAAPVDHHQPRYVLDHLGHDINRKCKALPVCRVAEVRQVVVLRDQQDGIEIPPPPPHPTEIHEIRRLIRSKMIRCKRCKNRFVEKNVYERHLRDRHPADYEEYIAEQELEMEQQRQEEIENNRIEEITSGGFIPPEDEVQAAKYLPEINHIPLPGENSGGVAPRFDIYGRIKAKRPYKKKVSPQCPFCDKRYRNEYSLKKHFQKKHPEMLEFEQCTQCFKCLKDKVELANHECELTYVCFECTPIRNLITDARLLNHRKKFHRGANSGFRCNFCNLKFLTPRKLRKHKKMSHVFTKTYQCHFCEEIFISEIAVMTHERVHTGIIKFECKICDFKANRYVQMEEHNRDEHGYLCPMCQGGSTRMAEWSELKAHALKAHGCYLSQHDSCASYIESPRIWVLYKGD